MSQSPTLTFLDGRITIDPAICNGKPTLRGKRIAVQTILDFLAAGDSEQDILEQYSGLEHEDIHVCLRFAALLVSQQARTEHSGIGGFAAL